MTDIKRYVFETQEDWLQWRVGMFTSSEVNRLMAEPTKKAKEAGKLLSEGAVTYIIEKLSAQFEAPKPVYFSNEMQWGNDNEPSAALLLCDLLSLDPQSDEVIYTSEGGKVLFSDGKLGGTPDMILPFAIAEIKCPNSDTHLYYKAFVNAYNFKDELPKYYDQMQANMYLCEREFCAFLSYDPRFKDEARQYHYIAIKRDQERINQILEKVSIAFDYMQELKTKL
jgi:hypothetical protein